jgi:hypothetical protein
MVGNIVGAASKLAGGALAGAKIGFTIVEEFSVIMDIDNPETEAKRKQIKEKLATVINEKQKISARLELLRSKGEENLNNREKSELNTYQQRLPRVEAELASLEQERIKLRMDILPT